MSRRRGTIKQVEEGRWLVRLSLGTDANGKRLRINKVIRGTKGDADRLLTSLLSKKDAGLPLALTKDSVGEWVEEWLTTWCGHISDRTRLGYRALLDRYLPPEIRVRKLASLTPTEVQAFVNGLVQRGLGPRTVRMAHGALRTSLNQAVRVGKIGRNPADAKLVKLPQVRRHEAKFLTPEQAQRFLDASDSDRWHAFFAVLILAGLRPAEALGLKWEDFDGQRLVIRRAVTYGFAGTSLGPPKTRRSRAIPLGERAVRALQRHRATQAEHKLKLGGTYEDEGLIFASETGGLMDSQNIVNRHFKPILQAAKLPNIRLYDLRHSHATLLMAAGEHPKVVQERLGHSTIQLTLDTYTHVVPGMQERAAAKLESLLDAERAKEKNGSRQAGQR